MKQPSRIPLPLAAAWLLAVGPASGIIVHGEPFDLAGTPPAHTRAPAVDPCGKTADCPVWERSVHFSSSSDGGKTYQWGGSGVYLGENWVIGVGVHGHGWDAAKQAHLRIHFGQARDSEPWSEIDHAAGSFQIRSDEGDFPLDIQLFRIKNGPALPLLDLAEDHPAVGNKVLLIGAGAARSTGLQTGADGTKGYRAMANAGRVWGWAEVTANNGHQLVAGFKQEEGFARAGALDSGSGMFSFNILKRRWELCGINRTVGGGLDDVKFGGTTTAHSVVAARGRIQEVLRSQSSETNRTSCGPALWQIGQADNDNREFSLAPGSHTDFRADGLHVVGISDPKRDWPYVHPGPLDAWAGRCPHTFRIIFGLKAQPADGMCRLTLDLIDAHQSSPPRLGIFVNGKTFDKDALPGTGDASISGKPEQGRESLCEVAFPSSLLHAGENEIAITTNAGSWMLYDAVKLETPAGTETASVERGTRVTGLNVPPVWLKRQGKPVQAVEVHLRHIGEPVRATARLTGGDAVSVSLVNGTQRFEVTTPAEEGKRLVKLEVSPEGQAPLVKELTLTPPKIRDIWVLPHSHVDIGYTHPQAKVIDIQVDNLKTAMRLARESVGRPPGERFKWNPEAVWTLDHFLQRATPAERDEFLQAVRRREVGIDGLFGNMLTGLCRPEELAQCLSYGARLADLTSTPVESAAICDVPGWTWGLVPVMARAGVKYFAIGPNHAERVGAIHHWDNKPFYWKSQSGRERILCWVLDNYHHQGSLDDNVNAHIAALNRIDFPYDMSFLFWVGQKPNEGLDNSPPDEMTVEKVAAWNTRYAAPRLTIGLIGECFREFERRHGPRLEEFAGDITPYWEDGAGSTARETAMNRATADRLSQAQSLFAMRNAAASPQADFDAAWKNVLLFSEHTWGAWCSVNNPDSPFTLDQWKTKQGFALEADRQAGELLAKAMPGGGKTDSIDVFNTTQWERTDLALVRDAADMNSVLDDRGQEVPSQRLRSGELAFIAAKVPPFAAKRYRLAKSLATATGTAKIDGTTLLTQHLRVELDPTTGAVKSLRTGDGRREFVDPAAAVGLNDFRYLPESDTSGAKPSGPVLLEVLDPGPLVATLRVVSDAPGCHRLTREVRVIDGLERVEFVNHVDRKPVREKDGVHFGFGFLVPDGQIRMETPWAVVRPNIDQLPGSCHNWFTVQRWVDVSNQEAGVTWVPVDAPLMQIGAMTGNVIVGFADGKWQTRGQWLDRTADSQTLYSWAQNNHWGTNYKADQPGITTFRFLVRPHEGGHVAADAARFGMEATRPLLVGAAVGDAPPPPLLALSSDKVLVETVKASADGKALLLSLFGVGGEDQQVSLRWGDGKPRGLWHTDLTGKPLSKAGNQVEVPAHGLVLLRAE